MIKVDNHKVLRAGYRFVSTFIDFYRHQHVKWTKILCISIVSVKSCTALIMAINLNKVALKPEKNICYLQSATECLLQEIWRNAPWFAPLAFNITSSLKFIRLLRVVFSSQQRLNRLAINAVQWRHSLTENQVVILIGWLSKHLHNYEKF